MMKKAGTVNPVFLLDEIDKMSMDFRGDPSAALLEVLDPAQNHAFVDHFLDVEYDLSKVMFIATANVAASDPGGAQGPDGGHPALGLHPEREAGDRQPVPGAEAAQGERPRDGAASASTTRPCGSSSRATRARPGCATSTARSPRSAASWRGESSPKASARRGPGGRPETDHRRCSASRASAPGSGEEQPEIGVTTGLAWTEVGGEILETEVGLMRGKGKLILTGKLGEVMQESARAAVSYLRSRAETFSASTPTSSEKFDLHIHVPEGAIPKDGPSAGITMATALVSALTQRPVRRDLAMTGEITLRGKVLPVGGIKDKALAAFRAGITEIILPRENEKDLEDIPAEVRDVLQIHLVESMDEVLRLALAGRACMAAPNEGEFPGAADGAPDGVGFAGALIHRPALDIERREARVASDRRLLPRSRRIPVDFGIVSRAADRPERSRPIREEVGRS